MSSSDIRYTLHNGWEQKSKAVFNFIPCKCTENDHSYRAEAEQEAKTFFEVWRFSFDLFRLRFRVCSFVLKRPMGSFHAERRESERNVANRVHYNRERILTVPGSGWCAAHGPLVLHHTGAQPGERRVRPEHDVVQQRTEDRSDSRPEPVDLQK